MSIRQDTILEILRRDGPMTAQEIGDRMAARGMVGATSSRAKVAHTLRVMSRYGLVRTSGERVCRNGAKTIIWEASE